MSKKSRMAKMIGAEVLLTPSIINRIRRYNEHDNGYRHGTIYTDLTNKVFIINPISSGEVSWSITMFPAGERLTAIGHHLIGVSPQEARECYDLMQASKVNHD